MPKGKGKHYRIWRKYSNLLLLTIGIIFALWLARNEALHQWILGNQALSYAGIVFAGFLFVISFTAPTGAVLLLLYAEKFNAIEIGLIAAIGSVLADLIIFRFVKDTLIDEIRPLYEQFGGNHLSRLLRTKYFSWTLPIIGAILLASPLPDELGVTLLGMTKMSTLRFTIVAFILDALGIALVVLASTVIKP